MFSPVNDVRLKNLKAGRVLQLSIGRGTLAIERRLGGMRQERSKGHEGIKRNDKLGEN